MHDRLSAIDAELEQIAAQEARRTRLDTILTDLYAQQAERQQRERETAAAHFRELADVERLEGLSLRSLLLRLTGDKEARLSKERREEAAARLQHDQAVRDLDYIQSEILRTQEEHRALGSFSQRKGELLREKERLLIGLGGETGRRLTAIDAKLTGLRAQLREVGEALLAGRSAAAALQEVLDELSHASDLGVWDMLGGGLLVTMAKHSHIDEARGGIDRAQRALSHFRSELADVGPEDCPTIQIGEFATFADYFFDGLLADWAVQSGIREARDSVNTALARVHAALARLETLRGTRQRQLTALEQERATLLGQ